MTETKTPSTTPSPTKGAAKSQQVTVGKPENPSSVFVSMALDMSWRLAAVVLIPIIGGFELDTHLGTTPLLTVTGFILAMGGMALVMWQTLQAASQVPVAPKPKQEKRS